MTGVIITTLGGLGMFILGMKMMTEGLQMSAGKRIKAILSAVSSNRLIGCLTGTVVTAMVQSSSATTVMLIGFVTAGLMTLQQAVGMILGANIGTTVTAQLIAFKLTALALPAIAVGVVLKYFTQQKKTRYIGEVILGFGLLFYGMTVMKHGLSPIKTDPAFLNFFTRFDPSSVGGLLLCVVVGAGLTIMVQSSSATIGLTMTLASQGLLTFPGAMALVLGGKHRHHHYGRTGHHWIQQHQRPSGRAGPHDVQRDRRVPDVVCLSLLCRSRGGGIPGARCRSRGPGSRRRSGQYGTLYRQRPHLVQRHQCLVFFYWYCPG